MQPLLVRLRMVVCLSGGLSSTWAQDQVPFLSTADARGQTWTRMRSSCRGTVRTAHQAAGFHRVAGAGHRLY